MLEKLMYNSWESRIRLFIKGKKHGRMMLDSIDNGLLVYPTVEENRGKDIWDKVKMLMKGTGLSYQERECRLYNLFDKFAYVQGETLYEYYWRFSQLINDIHTIGMTMQQVQVNTKLLNFLPSEWSKFVTDEKDIWRDSVLSQKGQGMLHGLMEKLMLAETQEAGQILDEEQLTFLGDPEQAFWLKHSSLSETPVMSHTPVRIEAPCEFPMEKVFAITTLKNELRKLKGKNVVNTVVSKPNATIAPVMFKLDIEPISPRLKNNRDAYEVYIEKTIEYTNTLRGFVKITKTHNPSEPLLESACMFTKHVKELLVYAY
nr:hypothetical protein [Tanacetum cinerariifolium]